MDDMSLVQVLEAEQRLSQDVLDGVFGVLCAHSGDNRSQGVVHDLDEDPEAALVVILVVNGQHEVIFLTHVHQGNLVDHELFLTLIL